VVKHLTLERILALNPHINAKTLRDALELMRKLRERGVKRACYNLTSPYSGRRVFENKDISSGSRSARTERACRQ
jgi:hypothetical protein